MFWRCLLGLINLLFNSIMFLFTFVWIYHLLARVRYWNPPCTALRSIWEFIFITVYFSGVGCPCVWCINAQNYNTLLVGFFFFMSMQYPSLARLVLVCSLSHQALKKNLFASWFHLHGILSSHPFTLRWCLGEVCFLDTVERQILFSDQMF